jgi:hypothetical protein
MPRVDNPVVTWQRWRCRSAIVALLLADWAYASTLPQGNTVMEWNSAALQGIRDAKLGAPVVARTLAIVHTCMYDAWAAYDERAVAKEKVLLWEAKAEQVRREIAAASCMFPKKSAGYNNLIQEGL